MQASVPLYQHLPRRLIPSTCAMRYLCILERCDASKLRTRNVCNILEGAYRHASEYSCNERRQTFYFFPEDLEFDIFSVSICLLVDTSTPWTPPVNKKHRDLKVKIMNEPQQTFVRALSKLSATLIVIGRVFFK